MCGCVCVCAGGASGGGLSVITISDWVRAKVCDISQPSTRGAAVEAHLRVTLSRRSSLCLSFTETPASVLLMQGVSARLLQCDCAPRLSSPPLSSPHPSFRSFYPFAPPTPLLLTYASRLSSLFSSSFAAASDCTGLFGMQEAPEAWRV